MFGELTYLVLELAWAMPVVLVQFAVGHRELWQVRRAWFGATATPTLYLCAADRLAIGDGIWQIVPSRSTGILILGLPVEEADFFLLTNLMVVQAMLLIMSEPMRAKAVHWARFVHRDSRRGSPPVATSDMTATTVPTPEWHADFRHGYRRGMFGAVAGSLLSSVAGALLASPSALEPIAQAVMQLTPVSIENVLLQALGPNARPLALLGIDCKR